jgi:hypothetical protein
MGIWRAGSRAVGLWGAKSDLPWGASLSLYSASHSVAARRGELRAGKLLRLNLAKWHLMRAYAAPAVNQRVTATTPIPRSSRTLILMRSNFTIIEGSDATHEYTSTQQQPGSSSLDLFHLLISIAERVFSCFCVRKHVQIFQGLMYF